MSRPAVHAQVSPPGDQELADLYNQVLIGFAEESPTSEHSSHRLPSPADREHDAAHAAHGAERGDTPRSMQSLPQRSPACTSFSLTSIMKPDAQVAVLDCVSSCAFARPAPVGLPASPRSLPTPVATSPAQGRPVRRLPPIPGQPALPSPPPPPRS